MTPSVLLLVASLAAPAVSPIQASTTPAPKGQAQATPTTALGEAYFLFMQGLGLEDAGDTAGALAAYKKALDLAPKAAEIHAQMASLYATQGRANESITEAQAALQLDPVNRTAHRILGFVQAALADRTPDPINERSMMTQAIDHFEQALSGGVRDPGAELTLGRLYVSTRDYQKGIARLQLFLLGQPGYPEALMLLAGAFDSTGRTAEAVEALEEVVEQSPDQVQPRSWLAELYEKTGRWKDAAAAWGELAKQNPRQRTYAARQASAMVNSGDLVAGRQQLAELTKQTPGDVALWYLLAQVERRVGNAAGVEDAAQHIIALDAKDARGPIALASAKAARADYRGAIETLEPRVTAATETDVASGTFARMASDLADAYEKSGDRARAIKVLEDARRRDADDDALRFGLANAYERDKRFDQAEQLFREVIAKEPQNADALNYLGYLLADRGQKLPEALGLVQRALALQSGNPSFLDSLGWIYVKQEKLDDARDPLEKAAAALPKTSLIQDHLGELYFRLKRYRDAAGAWDRALAGDRESLDVDAVTKKRDRARELAK